MSWKKAMVVGVVVAVAGVGCALPMGSFARPAAPVPAGTSVIGAGLLVPFAIAGGSTEGPSGDSVSFSAFGEGALFVPGFSYDYATDDGDLWGADFAVLSDSLSSEGGSGSATIIKINPRVQWAIGDGESRNLSWGIDTNVMIWTAESQTLPLFSPTIGIRYYLNTGFGGLVLAQNIGTAIVTLTAPGSVSYDIPIGPIHILPEFRWDPTFFFSTLEDTPSGAAVFFSAGATVLVEL
jgi:hypothetical protein